MKTWSSSARGAGPSASRRSRSRRSSSSGRTVRRLAVSQVGVLSESASLGDEPTEESSQSDADAHDLEYWGGATGVALDLVNHHTPVLWYRVAPANSARDGRPKPHHACRRQYRDPDDANTTEQKVNVIHDSSRGRGASVRRGEPGRVRPGARVVGARADRVSWPEATPSCRPVGPTLDPTAHVDQGRPRDRQGVYQRKRICRNPSPWSRGFLNRGSGVRFTPRARDLPAETPRADSRGAFLASLWRQSRYEQLANLAPVIVSRSSNSASRRRTCSQR